MEDDFYRQAMRRIERLSIFLSLAGAIGSGLAFSPRHALSFALGAAIAFISFLFLKRMVYSIGGDSPPKSKAMPAIGMGLRYLIIGGGVAAVIRFTEVSPWPVLAGLLTTVAAVLAEIVFELLSCSPGVE